MDNSIAVFSQVRIKEPFGISTLNNYAKVKLESTNVITEEGSIGFTSTTKTFSSNSEEAAKVEFTNNCDKFRSTHHELMVDFENAEALSFNRPNSQLGEPVAGFLQRLLDHYMPLGIPNIEELNKAREVLKQIEKSIKSRPSREQNDIIDEKNNLHEFIFEKSNEFYQMIPHAGAGFCLDIRKGFRPPIETLRMWRVKTKLLNRIETVLKTIKQAVRIDNVNPMDYFCDNLLYTEITPILRTSHDYQTFMTDFSIHSDDISQIKTIFKVDKSTWNEEFRKDINKQHYLFHTTHMSKMIDILRDGLVVAPDYVVTFNRWLGKGIYFFGNSKAVFSYAAKLKYDAILICRVALGEQEIAKRYFDYRPRDYILELDQGKNSLLAPGRGFESTFDWNDQKSAYLPAGINTTGERGSHYDSHDEFLVQHEDQVKIEYIIELNDQIETKLLDNV